MTLSRTVQSNEPVAAIVLALSEAIKTISLEDFEPYERVDQRLDRIFVIDRETEGGSHSPMRASTRRSRRCVFFQIVNDEVCRRSRSSGLCGHYEVLQFGFPCLSTRCVFKCE